MGRQMTNLFDELDILIITLTLDEVSEQVPYADDYGTSNNWTTMKDSHRVSMCDTGTGATYLSSGKYLTLGDWTGS